MRRPRLRCACSVSLKTGSPGSRERGLPEPGIARRDVEVALLVGERGRIRCWVAAAVAGRPERVGTNAVLRFRLESVASQVGDAGANVS